MTEEKTTATKEPAKTDAKAAAKAPAKKFNKYMHQKTYTSEAGNDYLFSFIGTMQVQQLVIDASMRDGKQMESLLDEALMKYILEGDYDWDFFDKKIPAKERTMSMEAEDFDGKKVTYKFKFPGLEWAVKTIENTTSPDGSDVRADLYKALMTDVIQNKDVQEKPDYWDHHKGYFDVMNACDQFIGNIIYNSEFNEVMSAAAEFVGEMFR